MGTQLIKQYLYGKKMQKTCTKNMSQNPLGKSLKQHMHEMFLKISYFKGGLSKNLEKVIFIFILKPAPFYRHHYEKQKGPRTSYQ